VNLDCRPLPGVDVVRDLRRGIPFDDDSFDEILIDNVLEHFDVDDARFLIDEMYRVLRPGGKAVVIVPHARSDEAVQDPTHRSFYVAASARHWNQCEMPHGGLAVGIAADFWPYKVEETGSQGRPHVLIRFELTAQKPARSRT
jgi:ubiquinone/menaquinone biosynthesis C-methylase UbiE